MILTSTGLIVLIMFGVVFILLVFLIFINRVRILSFWFPQNYNVVTMLEADNNITTWTQKKNSDLRFQFNDGFYNMYDTVSEKVTLTNPDGSKFEGTIPARKTSSIYRSGRLAQFFYVEGNADPLDFRNNTITSNPQMRKQMLSVDLTKLWTMKAGLKNWVLYAIIGLLVGLIIGSIVGGWNKIPKPVEQTAQILLFFKVKNGIFRNDI